MRLDTVFANLGKGFFYYPQLARTFGISSNACLLLCYIGWEQRPGSDGWVERTTEQIELAVGLTRKEQANAREQLVAKGLIEENYARLRHQLQFRLTGNIDETTVPVISESVPSETQSDAPQLSEPPEGGFPISQKGKWGITPEGKWGTTPKGKWSTGTKGTAMGTAKNTCVASDAPPSESVSVASPAATGSLPGLEAEPPTESGIAAPPLAVGGPQGGTPASMPSEPPKRPKAEKEPNPDFNEFRDAFASAFKRRTGAAYAFQGGKDGTAAKRVLSVCGGAEGAIRLLDAMEAAPESWTHKSCRAGLCSIAVMSSRLNEIRAELAASSRVPGTKPTAPVTPVPKAKPQFEFNGKAYAQEPPRGAFPAGQIGDQIHEAAVAKWKRWVQFGEA